MHDEPRHKLRELILKYGHPLCNDSQRCEALLKDVCGQYRKEIFVLTTALKNRVADELLKNSAGVPPTLLAARLIKRLEDDAAMSSEAAQWAVESWMLALEPAPIQSVTTTLSKSLLVPVKSWAQMLIKKAQSQVTPIATPAPSPVKNVVTKPVAATPQHVTTAVVTPVAKPVVKTPPHVSETLLGNRYRDHGNGTLTDVKTKLQWMRFSLGQEWKNGTCAGEAEKFTLEAAKEAVELLNEHGGYAGFHDWRLPTKDELLTLVYCSSHQPKYWKNDDRRCQGDYKKPTIYHDAFPNTPNTQFWSGSPVAGNSGSAWVVYFNDGNADYSLRNFNVHVRLVRSGQ